MIPLLIVAVGAALYCLYPQLPVQVQRRRVNADVEDAADAADFAVWAAQMRTDA